MNKTVMFQIDICRIVHRGRERLLLSFPYEATLIQRIKGIDGRKYTKTYKGWHLPYEVKSLTKLQELNIGFNIAESDRNDSVFSEFEKLSKELSVDDSQSDRFDRKVTLLIDTLRESHREIMKEYIYHLKNNGYSWTGIKYFLHYGVALLKGEKEGFALKGSRNLGEQDYIRMQEIFLEFRSQK